jgi:hypothetical protein
MKYAEKCVTVCSARCTVHFIVKLNTAATSWLPAGSAVI